MHEASIAKYVVEIVQNALNESKETMGKRVKSIEFELSKPYTVYPDSFEFYFVELIKGTHLEGASLLYKEVTDKKGFFVSKIDIEDENEEKNGNSSS